MHGPAGPRRADKPPLMIQTSYNTNKSERTHPLFFNIF